MPGARPSSVTSWPEASLSDVIETVDGEIHVVPTYEVPKHRPSRDCWCRPWQDGKEWVHVDPPRRPYPVGYRPLGLAIFPGAGVPGDGE